MMQYGDTYGPPPRPRWVNLPLIIAFILVVILGFWMFHERRGPAYNPEAKPRETTPRGDLMEIERTQIDLYQSVKDSVVYITTYAVRSDIFRLNISEIPQGSGSGFIWDRDGHVVTNFHVIVRAVQGGQKIRVTLADRSEWEAQVVGYEPEMDLAVLQINAPTDTLQPIPLGTSKDLKVGQMVFAIGNPFGFDQTLTTGVVSALEREINSVVNTRITGVIQTNADINPGNSGGPLLDSAGRLIGVTTSIAAPAGQSAGIGFAVPVDTVNLVVPQIIRGGRAGLGVSIYVDKVREYYGFNEGALVAEVVPESAADKAGIQSARIIRRGGRIEAVGDLIVGVDDYKISSRDDLIRALGKYNVGDKVRVTVLRGNDLYEAFVILQPVFGK